MNGKTNGRALTKLISGDEELNDLQNQYWVGLHLQVFVH